MGLHKLTAGSGYDYLTRQVAALDATEERTRMRLLVRRSPSAGLMPATVCEADR